MNHVAKWDGTAWSPLGIGIEPLGYHYFNALLWCRNTLFIGGRFGVAGGTVSAHIAAWRP